MGMDLRNRLILVTGASSGIGAATALAAAQRGARPILLARSQARLDAQVAAIGTAARAYAVDCADREAVAAVADTITHEVGTPDVIVNNAGAGRFLFFEETDPAEFEQMMAAPFFAAIYVTRAFLPDMIERNTGSIVNVNAPIAFVAWQGLAGYAAARWALRGFNEALRADLRGTGLRVTQVVPGKVASTYFDHNPGAEEGIPRLTRLLRTLSPEDVAEVILDAIGGERRLVVAPFMLRLVLGSARFFPRPLELALSKTSRPRPTPRS